ncbi:ICP22 family protein [Streptomyces ipomoeae]|uniref:Secreted protein n=1 Tax=Streptomyces ipomoeae 91-03 TaxID=698759 RepID=L1L6V9_9ACTN|nr:hypothetical protein STRIP9103_05670 [Streptomyces ipomoeae 91-03]
MPRGRHRHSPPLHRLLPPTAIAGVSLVCALGPWMFSEPAVLRVSAAVAAATAAVGAAVMRRWDVEAGKRVADLTRARASDEWRHEEKVAELETDLEESRELRTKLEHKLRAKRAELANLRNEHAALLRRYATAETERASALEGRRLLEIETTGPGEGRALSAGAGAGAGVGVGAGTFAQTSPVPPQGVPAPGVPWGTRGADGGSAAGQGASAEAEVAAEAEGDEEGAEGKEVAAGVFSPAGSSLFLRANSALERIITQRAAEQGAAEGEADEVEVEAEAVAETGIEGVSDVEAESGSETGAEDAVEVENVENGDEPEAGVEAEEQAVSEDEAEPEVKSEAGEEPVGEAADRAGEQANDPASAPSNDVSADASVDGPAVDGPAKGRSSKDGSGEDGSPKGDPDGPTGGGSRQGRPQEVQTEPVPVAAVEEDDPAGQPGAVGGHEHAAAEPVPAQSEASAPALPAARPSGHFTVPTAVAVVPAAPQRRAAVEGGFDFFGTQKGAETIAAVQNEDLADVVGQEALALHKAESEARFKRADEASRGVGQVIDLTAHDETEQIDVQGLRTAAS